MTAPLTPQNCDLTDFARMMVDIPRLRGSDFDATLNDAAWRAGLNLWMTSWHQVPAASLSDDENSLTKAAGLGRDVRTWRKVRTEALRGWIKCDDGLLYHPVVAEYALEAWLEKLNQALASGAGNAKRWGAAFDPVPVEAEIDLTAAMLTILNPKSKALSKLVRRRMRPESPRDPGGTRNTSRRDTKTVPSGSLENGTGMEGGSSDPNGSGVPPDLDKAAWGNAIALLVGQGAMREPEARRFFGKLLSANALEARDLLAPVSEAMANATQDPQAYLTRAAQARARRRAGGPEKRVGFV